MPRRLRRRAGDAAISAHLKPGEDCRPITGDELALTTVYRIDIESWSGKRRQVEPDFPGAFFYSAGAAG